MGVEHGNNMCKMLQVQACTCKMELTPFETAKKCPCTRKIYLTRSGSKVDASEVWVSCSVFQCGPCTFCPQTRLPVVLSQIRVYGIFIFSGTIIRFKDFKMTYLIYSKYRW